MILFPTDEAAAFDALAILYVKRDRKLNVSKEIAMVERALRKEFPHLDEILLSHHFFVLYQANRSTFEAVSNSGKTPVQEANYSRYKAKKALQQKFWPNTPLMEKKRKDGC